jgi:signal transduction histidine kinase
MEKGIIRLRWGLKRKLVLLTLVVGAVPLLLGIGMAYVQGTRELETVIGSSFAGLATETARKLDLVFGDELTRLSRIAADPVLIEALQRGSSGGGNPPPRDLLDEGERRWEAHDPLLVWSVTTGPVVDVLRRLAESATDQSPLRAPQAVTRAFFLTDARGRLVASINHDVGYAHSDDAWWQRTYDGGRGQAGGADVLFDRQLGTYTVALAVPVLDVGRGRAMGVLRRVFDAKTYLDPSLAPIRFGKTGHVMLIDGDGTVMSCPILPTGTRLADRDLVRLVTAPQAGWVRTPSDGHGGQTMSIVGFSPVPDTSRITQRATGRAWHTFAWQSSDELFAPTRHLSAWFAGFGLIAIGLLGALAYVAASRIVTPIRRLQEGAVLIGRNELTQPIVVRTGDEIEQLADEINRMHARLQQAFSGLSHTVEEKTEEVRSLRQYNEKILDSMPNPVVILDRDRVEYVNQAAKRAFRWSDEAVRGGRLLELLRTDEVSSDRLRSELRTPGTLPDRPADAAAPTGSPDEPRDPLSPRPAAAADPAQRELRIGSAIYRYDVFHIQIPSTGTKRIGLVLRDMTGERRLQEQLIQAEKLEGLGVLTSGIGHELNNPLFGILGLGEAIRDESDAARMREHAGAIIERAQHMAGIIRDFAGSAHPEVAESRSEVDVNERLDHALKVVGLTSGVAGLAVRKHYHPVPRILAAPDEIGQVLVSVITNAIQAMKGKGTIDLTTEASAESITISIHDSGPGIPNAYLSKIFDPFFTTKAPGQGTGLGLTIARRLVMKYGGEIRVETVEGAGTTFILSFMSSAIGG